MSGIRRVATALQSKEYQIIFGCKCKSESEYVPVNVSSDTICECRDGIITHVLSH